MYISLKKWDGIKKGKKKFLLSCIREKTGIYIIKNETYSPLKFYRISGFFCKRNSLQAPGSIFFGVKVWDMNR